MNVLIITNKEDITSDFIVRELTLQNIPFFRLNTEEIGSSIHISLDLCANKHHFFDTPSGKSFCLSSFSAVYFRRPEIRLHVTDTKPAEEQFLRNELFYVLEGIYTLLNNAFWLNHVDKIRSAENKVYQLIIATENGFQVPSSLITDQQLSALKFYNEHNEHCIIKTVRSGLIDPGNDELVIFTNRLTLDEINSQRINNFPVYIQKLITKKFDLRVTVVGKTVFAARIDSQYKEESKIDWRNSSVPLEHSTYHLPKDICDNCIALTKSLGLNFGAIDLVVDEKDNYYFLEINPNGQWAWLEKRLGFPISKEITKLLTENADQSS